MKECYIPATTNPGANSELYETIYNNIAFGDKERADELYKHFFTTNFIREFGNWVEDYKTSARIAERNAELPEDKRITHTPVINQDLVNDIGEPKLIFDEKKGRYFYFNKYRRRRQFPLFQAGLSDIYGEAYVLEVARALGLHYIVEYTDMNFENINVTTLKEPLSVAIKAKIKSKIAEYRKKAETEEDPDEQEFYTDSADRLNASIAYLHEWQRLVEDYLAEIKINYTENLEDEATIDAEENNRDRAFDTSSWEFSTKNSISANVKLRLSLLTEYEFDEDGDKIYTRRDAAFDEPVFVPFDEVYGTLLDRLNTKIGIYSEGYREDIFQLQVAEIAKLAKKKPYFGELAKTLSGKDFPEDLKNEFFQAFNVDKNNFIATEIAEKGNPDAGRLKRYFSFKNLTNVGSRSKMIEGAWFANFADNFLNKKNVLTDNGRLKLETFINGNAEENIVGFREIYEQFGRDIDAGNATGKVYLEEMTNYLKDKWQELGIQLSADGDGLTHFLDLLKEDEEGDIDQAVEGLLLAFAATTKVIEGVLDGEVGTQTSPFETQSLFATLAEAQAFFFPEGGDASIFSGGKSKWIYSYPSYLSTKVKQWKADDSELLSILGTVNGRSSQWAKYLTGQDAELKNVAPEFRKTEVAKRIKNFHLAIFNTFQKENDAANADDYKNIAKNDFYADSYNKILNAKPYYSTPVPADKSNLYQIQIDYRVDANVRGNEEDGYDVNQEVLDIFYEYFRSEYDRIKQVYNEIQRNLDEDGKPIDKSLFRMYYHGKPGKEGKWDFSNANGLRSQIFPSLSPDVFNGEEHDFELYDKDGKPVADLISAESIADNALRDKIQDIIKNLIIDKVKDTQRTMYEKGIVELNADGDILNHGLDQGVFDSYEGDTLAMAGNIFVNGSISQIEFSKLYSGDVAYYKNTVDYKKRIPETYTDGLGLRLHKEDDEYFNIAVTENIERSSPFYDELVEMLGEKLASNYLSDINSADAQAWITPQRWAFIVRRTGKWNDTYQSAYEKMMKYTDDPRQEPQYSKEELKAVAQPLKGVYFEINSGVPTYLKYSQAVLVPGLVRGTSLSAMYKKMIYNEDGSKKKFKDQIHEVVTLDGMKVGPTVPDLIHDGKGGFREDAILTPLQLKNSGYKIQQNLPTKTFKATDIGSQLEKNIYGGLSNNLDEIFEVGDQDMTGQELIDHINNIVNELRGKGRAKLALQFGITAEGKIQNYDRIYDALIQDLRSRKGGNRNVLAALEAQMSPYGIPAAQKTLMNIFSSIFTRELVKIKTNGGSFIQLSNFGISKPPKGYKDRTGIIWSPALDYGEEIAEPKYLKDKEGNNVLDRRGRPKVQPGGVVISGSFIAKYIPNYREYTADQLFGKYDPKTGRYRGGKIDGRILQGLVGYRIPNQALASNDALQIVGILPEEMGDTVIAYTGITTKTGSDFDIDKMYIMMPEMKPIRKDEKVLQDYIFRELRGKSFGETVKNIGDIVETLDPESMEEFNAAQVSVEGLAKDLAASKGLENVTRAADLLINLILNNENVSTLPLAQEIREAAGKHGIVKLAYVEPDVDVIEEEIYEGLDFAAPKIVIVGSTAETKNAARRGEGIYTMRPNAKDEIPGVDVAYNYGNPFSQRGFYGTYETDTVANAVKAYRDWLNKVDAPLSDYGVEGPNADKRLSDVEPERRDWIQYQIEDGELVGKNLLYFKSGYRSHADELKDFANKKYTEFLKSNATPVGTRKIKKPRAYSVQSKKALANMLMQAYQAVLTHPKVIKEVMTPIDFMHVKDDINSLHSKPPVKDLEVFDVSSDIELKYEFLAGKAGVGMEANAYVDHIRGTMANLKLQHYYIGWGNIEGKETIFDREYSEPLDPKDLRAYVKGINKNRPADKQITEDDIKQIKIAYSLSAVLNAFVDIAKDPYITRGNWTTQTTNVGNMLLRAGVHPFKVNAFLGQPMIKEYVEYVVNKESKISAEASGNLKNRFRLAMVHKELRKDKRNILDMDTGKEMTYEEIYKALVKKGPTNEDERRKDKSKDDSAIAAITPGSIAKLFKLSEKDLYEDEIEILNKHIKVIKAAHNEIFRPQKVDVNKMSLMDMRHQIKTKADANVQLAMLDKFFKLQNMTKEIRDNITASRADVNGYGKNISSMRRFMNTLGKLLADEPKRFGKLTGYREKLVKDGKKTVLGGITENMQWVEKIMQNNPFFFLMANPFIMNTFDEISRDVHNDLLVDEGLGTKLEDQYYSYIMSAFPPLQMGEDELSDLVFNFPKELEDFMEDMEIEPGQYAILDELYPKRSAGGTRYLAMSNRPKDSGEAARITGSWNDLLRDYPDMGEALIRYSYATTGFNMSKSQFFGFVPYQWYMKHNIDFHILDVNNRLNKLNQSGDAVDETFIEQLYLNNIEDDQLVPRVYPTGMEVNLKGSGFVLGKEGKARRYVKRYVERMDPATGEIIINMPVYELIGYDSNDKPIYLPVPKMGLRDPKGFKVYEYAFDQEIGTEFKVNLPMAIDEDMDKLRAMVRTPEHAFSEEIPTGTIDFEKEVDDKLNCNEE